MRKIAVLFLVSLFAVFLLAGCGEKVGDEVDLSKIQVEVSVFNGGYGSTWLKNAAKEFNAANTGSQVWIRDNKDEYPKQRDNLQAGGNTYDIYVSTFDVAEAAALGYLSDMSDLWTSKVDGESDKTIEFKMKDADQFKAAYTYGEKQYALPLNDGLKGWVFDFKSFRQNLLLFGTDGNFIQSEEDELGVGRDGRKGTYDDGQPETPEQWDRMIKKIITKTIKPFTWAGGLSYYLNPLYPTLTAQYEGIDNFMLNYTLDGDYVNASKPAGANVTRITKENGYEVYSMAGREKALDFICKYLNNPANLHNDASGSASNTQAQDNFVIGTYKSTASLAQAAMLYEGDWWENEARGTFLNFENKREYDFAYGVRDYRFMMLPILDDYQSCKTNYVVPIDDQQNIVIKSTTDTEKLNVCKEFVRFIHRDKWMREFTVLTGGQRPYNYSLQKEDFENMTVFAKNCYEIYHDSNNRFIRPRLQEKTSDAYYNGKIQYAYTKIGSFTTDMPIVAFKQNYTSAQYFEGAKAFYQKNWSTFLEDMSK